ncbi:MAG: dTDP-4-dehydrorhamnose reductase [Phycisphaerales bacterium]|jgi:dTDP-4-dehydrorhamnose reductase|nr:dTDP-4-dehydrorhamnose reductase [Phycisphaerales bacterium]
MNSADRYSRTVIVGGRGMLATAIARQLSARGTSFVSLDRQQCDITNANAVADLFATHRPTLLINCAAHAKVDLCEQEPEKADAINGHAVGLLAQNAVQIGAKLVHFSTDFVFDGNGVLPYRPTDSTNPLSAYGRSKLLGEQQIQQINPSGWLILRTAWLYGEDGPCFPRTILAAAHAGKPLKVVNDQIGSPTYTADLAAATLELIDRQAAGLFHAVNQGTASWYEFTRAILDEFNLLADLTPQSSAEWKKTKPTAAHRPAYSVLDTSTLDSTLGHPMRPWRQALCDYHQACASESRA